MDEIEQMKVIYRQVDVLKLDRDFAGIDQYILKLISEQINFQLSTALIMITKNSKRFLNEREALVIYSKECAMKEEIPEFIMNSALHGII